MLTLPIILYHRIPRDQSFSSAVAAKFRTSSTSSLPLGDNSSLVEQMDNGDFLFNQALEGGPRIRQASMLFGTGEKGEDVTYERAIKTHLQHGERWGYTTHVLRHDIVGKDDFKVLVFGKLLYLQSLIVQEMARPFGKRAEWIVWFDVDTILLNQNIPWEAFLPPSDTFPDVHFLGNKDWNGYNCGVFFLRVNEWSVNFLTEASALPLLRPEVKLGVVGENYEQDAMVWVMNKEGYREHVVYQPRQWQNPFFEGQNHELEYQKGDMMLHFAGLAKKHSSMGKWVDELDQSPDDFNIPLANLTLRADIAHFWTRLNNAKVLLDKAWELQSDDSVIQMFQYNPALGDDLKDSIDELHKIYQETPYEKDAIRNAHSKLDAAIRATKQAKHDVKEAERANAKAKATLGQTPTETPTEEKADLDSGNLAKLKD
ncbi:hypothetical protein ACLMJK_009140 [Lecanora helva]